MREYNFDISSILLEYFRSSQYGWIISALYLCGQLGNFCKNFFMRAQNLIKQMTLSKLKKKFKLRSIQILLQHNFGHFWTRPSTISAKYSTAHQQKMGFFWTQSPSPADVIWYGWSLNFFVIFGKPARSNMALL